MTLLRPELLALGLLGIVIALCYIRIIPQPKQMVGSLDLWQMALARRPWWYGLQRPLSLALLLSIVALLTFAVAEPVILAPKQAPRKIVLVIDTSASMNAKEGDGTRLDAAKAAAGKWIDSLSANDRMAIVAAGGGLRFAADYTADLDKLKKALAEIQPSDSPDAVAEAISAFRDSGSDSDNGSPPQLIVFTDGVFPEYEKFAANQAKDRLTFSLHGSPVDNAGYLRVAARPSPDDNESYDVLTEHVSSSADLQPTLSRNNIIFLKPVSPLKTGNPRLMTWRGQAATGGLLTFHFNVEDGLAADNGITIQLEPRQSVPVYLVGEVHPSIGNSLEKVPGIQVKAVATLPPALPSGSVVVIQGDIPSPLPAAHLLIIAPATDSADWKLGEVLEPPPPVQMLGRAPFASSLDLADVVVERATGLKLAADMRVVAAAGETPILAVRESGSRRMVLLNLDLEKSDASLRPGWRPMVRSIVAWLGGRTERTVTCQSIEGPFTFAPAAIERPLTGPDGIMRKIAPQSTSSPPPERVGEWKLGGSSEETFHVMLGLASESQLKGPAKSEPALPPAKTESARDFHFAPWLILAAAVLVVLEWGLFHRRLTI